MATSLFELMHELYVYSAIQKTNCMAGYPVSKHDSGTIVWQL